MRRAGITCTLIAAAVLAGACGVAFTSPPRNNTLFQSLRVTGNLTAGSPLTAALAYQQYLPVPIDVRCELRQGSKLIKPIGADTVPQYPDGSPEQTPFPGNFSFDFTVDSPGDYKVACYTPADEDNTIAKVITVRRAPATPAP